jgi:hypothetical protein
VSRHDNAELQIPGHVETSRLSPFKSAILLPLLNALIDSEMSMAHGCENLPLARRWILQILKLTLSLTLAEEQTGVCPRKSGSTEDPANSTQGARKRVSNSKSKL